MSAFQAANIDHIVTDIELSYHLQILIHICMYCYGSLGALPAQGFFCKGPSSISVVLCKP